MKITLADINANGNCINGIRKWTAQHGISFREFAKDGIEVEALSHINDPMLTDCIEKLKNQQEKQNGRK